MKIAIVVNSAWAAYNFRVNYTDSEGIKSGLIPNNFRCFNEI